MGERLGGIFHLAVEKLAAEGLGPAVERGVGAHVVGAHEVHARLQAVVHVRLEAGDDARGGAEGRVDARLALLVVAVEALLQKEAQ